MPCSAWQSIRQGSGTDDNGSHCSLFFSSSPISFSNTTTQFGPFVRTSFPFPHKLTSWLAASSQIWPTFVIKCHIKRGWRGKKGAFELFHSPHVHSKPACMAWHGVEGSGQTHYSSSPLLSSNSVNKIILWQKRRRASFSSLFGRKLWRITNKLLCFTALHSNSTLDQMFLWYWLKFLLFVTSMGKTCRAS